MVKSRGLGKVDTPKGTKGSVGESLADKALWGVSSSEEDRTKTSEELVAKFFKIPVSLDKKIALFCIESTPRKRIKDVIVEAIEEYLENHK